MTGPLVGCSSRRHMIATTTGGIAHGISASVRATPRNLMVVLSSRARPSAATNCRIVTDRVQITPIRNESQNRSLCSSLEKLSKPMKFVSTLQPGARVGEAERDTADQRVDAEQQHRQQRGQEQEDRFPVLLRPASVPARSVAVWGLPHLERGSER